MKTTLQSCLAAALLVGATLAAAAPNPRSAFAEQVDALVQDGFERPEQALAVLQPMEREPGHSLDERRLLL